MIRLVVVAVCTLAWLLLTVMVLVPDDSRWHKQCARAGGVVRYDVDGRGQPLVGTSASARPTSRRC